MNVKLKSWMFNFVVVEFYFESWEESILIDIVIIEEGIDELVFEWNYEVLDMFLELVYFQLFCGNELIDIMDE